MAPAETAPLCSGGPGVEGGRQVAGMYTHALGTTQTTLRTGSGSTVMLLIYGYLFKYIELCMFTFLQLSSKTCFVEQQGRGTPRPRATRARKPPGVALPRHREGGRVRRPAAQSRPVFRLAVVDGLRRVLSVSIRPRAGGRRPTTPEVEAPVAPSSAQDSGRPAGPCRRKVCVGASGARLTERL